MKKLTPLLLVPFLLLGCASDGSSAAVDDCKAQAIAQEGDGKEFKVTSILTAKDFKELLGDGFTGENDFAMITGTYGAKEFVCTYEEGSASLAL